MKRIALPIQEQRSAGQNINVAIFVHQLTLKCRRVRMVHRSMIASSHLMQAFGVGGLEWVFIIIIVVVLFFGVKKIPEIARSVGRASSEYQKAKIQAKQELNQMNAKDGVDKSTIDRQKLESIADTLGIDSTNKNDADLREAIDLAISKERHKV